MHTQRVVVVVCVCVCVWRLRIYYIPTLGECMLTGHSETPQVGGGFNFSLCWKDIAGVNAIS